VAWPRALSRARPGATRSIPRRGVTPRVDMTSFSAPVDAVVDGPVENPSQRGITAGRDVDRRVDEKILEITGRDLLCWPRGERKNSLVAGNGDRPGETPATRERPGNREFPRVSGPGDRIEQRQRPSNRQVSAANPGEAPPSHAWRGLAFSMPAFARPNPAGMRTQLLSRVVDGTSPPPKGRSSYIGLAAAPRRSRRLAERQRWAAARFDRPARQRRATAGVRRSSARAGRAGWPPGP
jgi:hypothetical protein